MRCLCVLQPCYSLVIRCLDPDILGEVPVCATAWSSGLDPEVLGEVPVCATAVLLPSHQVSTFDILGEVPVV